jgi:alkylation response protein AidB-like acyl-CoA dehydrogenase
LDAGSQALRLLTAAIFKVFRHVMFDAFLPTIPLGGTSIWDQTTKMVNFSLTTEQKQLRANAQAFAKNVLSTAPKLYSTLSTQSERFQSTLPIYQTAIKSGLIKGQIPIPVGGTSNGLVDAAIVVEELHAVEPSTSITILGTGLGLTPLILAGSQEQHEKFLAPFIKQEGQMLASFMHSEPGGTANWLEKGAPGLQTTAYKDKDEWVVNGEKANKHHSQHQVSLLKKIPALDHQFWRLGLPRRRPSMSRLS